MCHWDTWLGSHQARHWVFIWCLLRAELLLMQPSHPPSRASHCFCPLLMPRGNLSWTLLWISSTWMWCLGITLVLVGLVVGWLETFVWRTPCLRPPSFHWILKSKLCQVAPWIKDKRLGERGVKRKGMILRFYTSAQMTEAGINSLMMMDIELLKAISNFRGGCVSHFSRRTRTLCASASVLG